MATLNPAPPTVDHMHQAQQLAQQNGINSQLFNEIQKKAETNTAMYEPTAQKQAVYDSLQNYFMTEIQKKATLGQSLDNTNAWKEQMYTNAQGQNTANQALSNMSPMQSWLEKASQEQLKAQQAQLGLSRDQQLAEIDKALQDAVNKGQLSVKEAEAQFEKAKQGIHQQAYQDSELTSLMGHDRGIQNSAQMVGLMQGDQARRNSLLNENLTVRDQQINAINNQLDQMRYNSSIDKSMANATYNYGLANAQGQINSDMYNNMASMSFEEYQRLATEKTQKEQAKVEFNRQLELMAKQHGYDLSKMSQEQKYALEQMFNQFQYESIAREDTQNFQGGQASLDRNHQLTMQENDFLNTVRQMQAENQLSADNYEVELGRLINRYTEGTPEHTALKLERDWARETAKMENEMNFLSELGVKEVTTLIEQFPKELPDSSDTSAVKEYNKKVEYVNKQLTDLLGKDSSAQYIRDLYKAKTGATEKEAKVWHQKVRDQLLKWTPMAAKPFQWMGGKVVDAFTP